MRIGVDVSVLRLARAGVLQFTTNLLDALARESAEHALAFVDVLPLNPGRPRAPLAALDAPHGRLVQLHGLTRRYWSALPGWRHGWRHRLAARADRLGDGPWALAAAAWLGLELRARLAGLAVFHGSDQFWYRPMRGAAVMTMFDLTYRMTADWHVRGNVALHQAKERFIARRATRLIAISQATARDVTAQLGVPADRVSVVYGAADPRFRAVSDAPADAVLQRHGLRRDGYLLSVGTLEPRKNHVRLIEAYARWAARQAAPPPLLVAGERGWNDEAILAAPARCGVAHLVRFLGRVADDELPALYTGCSAFLYPSLYEGFGLPPLEALACGAAVIASDRAALPEVLGDAAWLCDPTDVAALTDALERVLGDAALRARLRAAGPPWAARFSWRRAARETLAVYAQAYAESQERRA
jgi:glycosyltransferase involved in cell wall biosynthesis